MAKAPTKTAPTTEAPKAEVVKPAKPAPTARFKWNGTAEGLVAKSVIAILAGPNGKDLTGKALAAEVREAVPGLAKAYADGTGGNELTDNMITGRLQYMFFTAARGEKLAIKGEPSTEHPTHEACNVRFVNTYANVVNNWKRGTVADLKLAAPEVVKEKPKAEPKAKAEKAA